MENASYADAIAAPYIASLARQYGQLSNYHSVGRPSLPNYLALTSGNTFGVTDNDYRPLPSTGIGNQLSAAGISWRAYMEGLSGDCGTETYPYAIKHNPFAYYGGGCPANVVPLTALKDDLRDAATTPYLSWIGPGLCNDGHDCSTQTADSWLAKVVPQVIASPAWRNDGVLFITWDEGGGGDDHVLTLVVAPGMSAHSTDVAYDHYSLLATVEDLLGVRRLGQAASARPIAGLPR